MRKHYWLYLLFSIIGLALSTSSYSAAKPVILLEINGAIGPATQDYVRHGINYAARQKAELVILQLDTPGGLETSMRGINKAILRSPVPIVAYVSPVGARAASAGTFILYASHIAAMAPGTNLGAASPVNIGSIPFSTGAEQKNQFALQKKAMNDAVAYIRSLGQLRHRNTEWAELAVRQAVSLPTNEALKKKVIDLMATNNADLLKKLNGTVIQTPGATHYLQTKDTVIQTIKPGWRYQFLSVITEPSIAYILLLIGIYGLFFEFANPGLIVPGVIGMISLLLALYAFQLLPISYVGVTLLLGGIACLVAEVFISSFGVLGIGGIIAFIAGSIMLLDTSVPGYHIAWAVILTMSIVTAGFFFLVLTLAIRSLRKPVITGREALVGEEGEVLEYHADYVIVRMNGEIWSAHCPVHLQVGQKVLVKKVSNLILTVAPKTIVEKK